jgi:hypothetical protein
MIIFTSSYLGELIFQGRNWQNQEWGWSQALPSISITDTATSSAEGRYIKKKLYL